MLSTQQNHFPIPLIQRNFIDEYESNLSSYIPKIHPQFLERVVNNQKTPEQLLDAEQNVQFRKQIFLDFALNKMNTIYDNQYVEDNQEMINDIYNTFQYNNEFDITQPIQSLIKDSIIPRYNNLDKSDIKLYLSDSHGIIDKTIKKMQPNCIAILITPFNRYAYTCSRHLYNISETIDEISKTIQDGNNNIYDIIKMIGKNKCFDKSTIIFPNQYYFDYYLKTDENMTGLKHYNMDNKSFKNNNLTYDTTLENIIDAHGIKEPNKINVFFVRGCRSVNDINSGYNNFFIEKMYIYENFIKILNKKIYENLSLNDFQINESKCNIRPESKALSALFKRLSEEESKYLLLNSSLGSTFSDEEIYKNVLYKNENINNLINQLLKKNKKTSRFSKIEREVLIEFIEKIKKIILDEYKKSSDQLNILNGYMLFFHMKDYINEEDYDLILKDLFTEFERLIEKNNAIDNYLIPTIKIYYRDEFNITFLFSLFKLINYYNNLYRNTQNNISKTVTILKIFIDNLVIFALNFFIKNLDPILEITNKSTINERLLLFNIDIFITLLSKDNKIILINSFIEKNLTNHRLFYIILDKILSKVPPSDVFEQYILLSLESINRSTLDIDFIINYIINIINLIYNNNEYYDSSKYFIDYSMMVFYILKNKLVEIVNLNTTEIYKIKKIIQFLYIDNIHDLRQYMDELYAKDNTFRNNVLYNNIYAIISPSYERQNNQQSLNNVQNGGKLKKKNKTKTQKKMKPQNKKKKTHKK